MTMTSAIARGVALAAGAAVLFGLASPLIQRGSLGAGALASSALIYLGAAAVALLVGVAREQRDVPVRLASWKRMVPVALIGGAAAPALLVLGLRWTDAATGALLLTLEAPFTIAMARLGAREHVGRRALAGAMLLVCAGVVLAGAHGDDRTSLLGAGLVAAAALAWAVDNFLSRGLADYGAIDVVRYKGLLGGAAAAVLAVASGEDWPRSNNALLLVAIGGSSFGASLLLYLRAQRLVGAARTASVFAVAPFVGAVAAVAFGMSEPTWSLLAAAALIALGLWLHAGERHEHWHVHESMEHEHLHTHDDGHHDHTHDPMPNGSHSHVHVHRPQEHSHEHGEDIHHSSHA
jgi:drug/metabolite transporter (DMT)-like permease